MRVRENEPGYSSLRAKARGAPANGPMRRKLFLVFPLLVTTSKALVPSSFLLLVVRHLLLVAMHLFLEASCFFPLLVEGITSGRNYAAKGTMRVSETQHEGTRPDVFCNYADTRFHLVHFLFEVI